MEISIKILLVINYNISVNQLSSMIRTSILSHHLRYLDAEAT